MVSLPEPLIERRREIARFVEAELIPWEVHAEMNGGELPVEVRERHEQMAREMGLVAMDLPKEIGGGGCSILEQAVVWEQLGRVTNALSWCFPSPQRWMLDACTPEQIETWLKPILRGERHECFAITEEGPGSDLDSIRATARRDGDHYVLDGEKWHVTGANKADHFVFQARLAHGPHAGNHALFFVDIGAPGVELVRSPAYSHTFAFHHPIYRFNAVRVPAANRLGHEGDGLRFTFDWFRHERLMIAARCCGAAARLIDEALAFAKGRVAAGKPLAEHQAIQFMLADSATELWGARLMTYQAAANADAGIDVKALHAQCAMAKLYASEMAGRVADRAVQIFGGRGYMRENVAERFNRELRVDRIWEGTSEIQRLIVGNALIKRGREGLVG